MSYEIKHDQRRIRCPFCDKGTVVTRYTPPMKKKIIVRGSGMNKTKWTYLDERHKVRSECTVCCRKRNEIQKALNQHESRSPSRSEVLERLRKAGLPTRV